MPRPKGARDKKKRKLKKTAKKKSIKSAKKPKPKLTKEVKPAGPPEVTPYPRAGENPEFRRLLDELGSIEVESRPADPGDAEAAGAPEITTKDLAAIIKWPFDLWGESQQLPALRLSDKEAISVAEPLSRIMNRHQIAGVLPPDAIDAILFAARVTPVVTTRFTAVKVERQRRRKSPQGNAATNPSGPGARQGHQPLVQGF